MTTFEEALESFVDASLEERLTALRAVQHKLSRGSFLHEKVAINHVVPESYSEWIKSISASDSSALETDWKTAKIQYFHFVALEAVLKASILEDSIQEFVPYYTTAK